MPLIVMNSGFYRADRLQTKDKVEAYTLEGGFDPPPLSGEDLGSNRRERGGGDSYPRVTPLQDNQVGDKGKTPVWSSTLPFSVGRLESR